MNLLMDNIPIDTFLSELLRLKVGSKVAIRYMSNKYIVGQFVGCNFEYGDGIIPDSVMIFDQISLQTAIIRLIDIDDFYISEGF